MTKLKTLKGNKGDKMAKIKTVNNNEYCEDCGNNFPKQRKEEGGRVNETANKNVIILAIQVALIFSVIVAVTYSLLGVFVGVVSALLSFFIFIGYVTDSLESENDKTRATEEGDFYGN